MKGRALSRAERADWLALARTPQVGPVTFAGLIERYGDPGKAMAALPRLAKRGGRVDPLKIISRQEAEAELDHLDEIGGRLLCACEPDFPALLAALDPPPPVIATLGPLDPGAAPVCAIVGARSASGVGLRFAGSLRVSWVRPGFSSPPG